MTNSSAIQSAIADYIRTGEADPLYGAWPGDWLEKAERGRRELREALLGPDAPVLVGFSEETTCYISVEYFRDSDPFADFIVHETAHIFHNCKRSTLGLAQTRRKEWLLDINHPMRETFAYGCEAYSRILERAANRLERQELAQEYQRTVNISDERVDASTLRDIVLEAATARNGWKRILSACSP